MLGREVQEGELDSSLMEEFNSVVAASIILCNIRIHLVTSDLLVERHLIERSTLMCYRAHPLSRSCK